MLPMTVVVYTLLIRLLKFCQISPSFDFTLFLKEDFFQTHQHSIAYSFIQKHQDEYVIIDSVAIYWLFCLWEHIHHLIHLLITNLNSSLIFT